MPNLIQSFDIIKLLRDADEDGQLERAKKHQLIDISTIEEKLDNIASKQLKMDFLSKEYPSLFVFILEHLNMSDRIA